MSTGLHVAVVGLRFGAEFVPIYQRHPAVDRVTIVDTDPARLERVGTAFGVTGRRSSLEALLEHDEDVDAVHLVTPVAAHVQQAIAVLNAGKHCACAVPMATSLEDLEAVIAAQDSSGCRYMMMETTVFSREFLYVDALLRDGDLGEPTFYRGFHMQDLDGFPSYWAGFPPMQYATHALSPALALTDTTAARVSCLGSSRLTPERVGDSQNPFPLEAAIFALRDHPMAVDVTMSFFQTARRYTEGFSVYGTRMGVEWPVEEGGPLRVHELGPVRADGRGRAVSVTEVHAPDQTQRLPESIAPFVRHQTIGGVKIEAAHGGSHPHLVHEFLSSIAEERDAAVDARTAAAWTAGGICAHQSALQGGEWIEIPDYRTVPASR
jgi:predicted dehydrogenase